MKSNKRLTPINRLRGLLTSAVSAAGRTGLVVMALLVLSVVTLVDHLSDATGPSAVDKQASVAPQLRTTFPRQAMERNYRQTVDLATGTVPVERLWEATELAKVLKLGKVGAASVTSDWAERGPSNVGGRTRAIMFDPNEATKRKVWAGGASGGLWFNTDITNPTVAWQSVDDRFNNLAITAIAYDPSNTNVLYFGTGEGFSSGIPGAGIWRSPNGGATWTRLANTASRTNDFASRWAFSRIQKIVVDAAGTIFAGTGSYGVQKCASPCDNTAGKRWQAVLGTFGDGASDIEIASDGTLFAALGDGSKPGGIFRSSDHGVTWDTIGVAAGGRMPANSRRVELATAPSDANVVYAAVTHKVGSETKVEGLYRSGDKGSTWSRISFPVDVQHTQPDYARGIPWYALTLSVDPNNPDRLFTGSVNLYRSANGGSTWNQVSVWTSHPEATRRAIPVVHADHHTVVFQPGSSNIAVFGHDGGISVVQDAAAYQPLFVSHNKGYNVTQFYTAALHPDAGSDIMLAGAQDNGTQRFDATGIDETDNVYGGDGAFTFIDQDDPHIVLASSQNNNFYRSTNSGRTFTTQLMPNRSTKSFINPGDYDDQDNILFVARDSVSLYRVKNVVSGPATPEVVNVNIGKVVASHVRVAPDTIKGRTTLFVGTWGGRVFRITDAQALAHSVEITPRNADYRRGTISSIDIGEDENQLLLTLSNYGMPSVWESRNGGASWSQKDQTLPDIPVRWAMYNPHDRNEVLLATEAGVWETFEIERRTPVWTPSVTMPIVRVDMLQYRPSDDVVMAATYGRGVWTAKMGSARGDVDIALLIDRSESMDSLKFMDPARDAAKLFLGLMKLGDRASVVSFSSSVAVDYPLSRLVSQADRKAAQKAVSEISAGGYTTIGGAIDRGIVELSKGPIEDVQAMVLLSDGKENQPPFVADVLPRVPDSVAIHTIALGAAADQVLLADIASSTGGTYRLKMSPDSLELLKVYDEIRVLLGHAQMLARMSGRIENGGQQSHTVIVDPTVRDIQITVLSTDVSVAVIVTDPDGNIFDARHIKGDGYFGGGVEWVRGESFLSFAKRGPVPGTWTVTITADAGGDAGDDAGGDAGDDAGGNVTLRQNSVAYAVSVSGESATRLVTEPHGSSVRRMAAEPIRVAVSLLDNDRPIAGAAVTADVLMPTSFAEMDAEESRELNEHLGGQRLYVTDAGSRFVDASGSDHYVTRTVELYDDGAHADGAANDGLYAVEFTDTRYAGTYQFDVSAHVSSGDVSYSRFAQSTYVVTSADKAGTGDGIDGARASVPFELTLSQNYPNPFAGSTDIAFTVAKTGRATITVYTLDGRRIAQLYDSDAEPGRSYVVPFDGGGLAAGVYVYALESGGRRVVRSLVLAK